MVVHFNNPNKYLVCRMCKVNKHISQYRFKPFYCRLCIYLHRYRFHHTKERFLEHAKKYNIHEVVSPISKAGSQIEVKLYLIIISLLKNELTINDDRKFIEAAIRLYNVCDNYFYKND